MKYSSTSILHPLYPFTHNFWTLADDSGHITDQIHGLAFDPCTATTKAIGNSRHLLQVIHDATIRWSLQPGQPAVVCAAGSKETVCQRWQAALNAIAELNALKLPYPNL